MKTVMLVSGVLVALGRLLAQTPDEAPLFALEAAPLAPAEESQAEPVNDLPRSPGPTIESITLFPNQNEIPSGNPFSEQRFGYVLHGQARAQYESNIFIAPTNEQADFIFTLSPGVAVGFGDFKSEIFGAQTFRSRFERFADKNYFYVDYSPSFIWFADNRGQDSVDQAARLAGEWNFQKLTVGVRGAYESTNAPSEDVGGRVEATRKSAALLTRYQLTGRTALEINGYYDAVDYDGRFIDSRTWRNENWLNYQLFPKTTASLGVVLGRLERSVGPSDTFEEAQLRLRYQSSEKLSIGLVAGPEFRQTDGAGDEINGIFSLDLSWTPSESTFVQLEGFRRSVASGAFGENFLATGVLLQFRQRLFQRFYVDLTGGFQQSDYEGRTAGGRVDELYFVRPGVGFGLASWLTCELLGEFRHNDSTDAQRGFDATKASVVFNVLF